MALIEQWFLASSVHSRWTDFSAHLLHTNFFLPKFEMKMATEEPVNKPAMRRGSRMRTSIDPYL